MSVRRETKNRLTLYRVCGTCGQSMITTADTPWVRQVPRDGKRQVATYYCCESCFAASYRHIGWYDGKTDERKKERDRKRKRTYTPEQLERKRERNREYMRRRRLENPDMTRLDNEFYRKKRKLLKGDGDVSDAERKDIIETYQSKMKEALDLLWEACGYLEGDIVCGDEDLTLNEYETLAQYIGALARMAYAEWTNV